MSPSHMAYDECGSQTEDVFRSIKQNEWETFLYICPLFSL